MCDGVIRDISNSCDEVFANKMMGDGFYIEPSSSLIVSPVAGEIVMLFPTMHALGIKDDKGYEYLLHIGIDSVNCEGKGFEVFVKVGDRVECGSPLAEVDFTYIKEKAISTDVILLLTDGRKCQVLKEGTVVAGQKDIVEID